MRRLLFPQSLSNGFSGLCVSCVCSGPFHSSSRSCAGLSGLLQLSSDRSPTSRHLAGFFQSLSSWRITPAWHTGISWRFQSFSHTCAWRASPRPLQSCSSGRVGLMGRRGLPRPFQSLLVPLEGWEEVSFSRRLCQLHSDGFLGPARCSGSPGFARSLSGPRTKLGGELSFWLFLVLSVRLPGLRARGGGPARLSLTLSEPFPAPVGCRESPRLFFSSACRIPPACQVARPLSKFGGRAGSPRLLQLFSVRQGRFRGSPTLLSTLQAGLAERGLRLPLSSSQPGLAGRGESPRVLLAFSGCRAGLGERWVSLGSLLRCSSCQESR